MNLAVSEEVFSCTKFNLVPVKHQPLPHLQWQRKRYKVFSAFVKFIG